MTRTTSIVLGTTAGLAALTYAGYKSGQISVFPGFANSGDPVQKHQAESFAAGAIVAGLSVLAMSALLLRSHAR